MIPPTERSELNKSTGFDSSFYFEQFMQGDYEKLHRNIIKNL